MILDLRPVAVRYEEASCGDLRVTFMQPGYLTAEENMVPAQSFSTYFSRGDRIALAMALLHGIEHTLEIK